MDNHQSHDPLVPGMPPTLTRVLAVGGDAARLQLLVANLRLRGYQVTGSSDPAAAMAGLRQGRPSFDLVIIDTHSRYPAGSGARQLFEFAIREPLLCAHALDEDGKSRGPLEVKDLALSRKIMYNIESNEQKTPHDAQHGPYNTSPSTTASTITNSPSLERRARRNNKKHVSDTCSQEVEQDRKNVENEEKQQPAENLTKNRVIWTDELHNKFVEAYDKLVITGDAVPKKILIFMNDSTLTRENIASHLQKYRLQIDPLRRSRSTPPASFPSHNMASRREVTSIESVPVDVPPKEMYPGADDPAQSSNKEPERSWDDEFLSSGSD